MNQKKFQAFLRDLISDVRWSHLFASVCLMVLSTLFIYSATYRGGSRIPEAVSKQWLWFAVGLVCYAMISMIDYHWFCRKAWLAYAGVLVLLVAVFKFGPERYGARRWLDIPHVASIQPSEFAKLSVLLLLCYYFSRSAGALNDWRRIAVATTLAVVPAALIHKEPDLGTALVVMALFFVLLFLAGAPMRLFAWIGLLAVLVAGVLAYETNSYKNFRVDQAEGTLEAGTKFKSMLHMKPYQLNRILVVVAPEVLDPLGERWNHDQSLIAIGNGGLSGKGWMKGEVTHGDYLPRTVALNDFIFAVYAEETGFWGCGVLILLYAIILLGGVKIAMKARDNLGMLLAAGVTFLIFFHVFVNIGMALGILPIVGVPLPLMSSGGSFVLVCMIALGLLQSVWLHRKPY